MPPTHEVKVMYFEDINMQILMLVCIRITREIEKQEQREEKQNRNSKRMKSWSMITDMLGKGVRVKLNDQETCRRGGRGIKY